MYYISNQYKYFGENTTGTKSFTLSPYQKSLEEKGNIWPCPEKQIIGQEFEQGFILFKKRCHALQGRHFSSEMFCQKQGESPQGAAA